MRQMLKDEGDEDVIRILALGIGAGLLEDFLGFITNGASAGIQLLDRGIGRRGLQELAVADEDVIELRLELVQLRAKTALNRALVAGLIEKDRRLFELVEKKDHRAQKQNEKLHRHFHEGIEEQTDPGSAERISGEIALDLRLVGPEIGEGEEKSAEQTRFFIETLPEIFVGSENFQALIDRDEDRADHDERERLSEIILDEPDAAFVSLAGHGEKRDRAGLGGEDGEADSSPANRPVAFQVFAEVRVIVGSPESVKRDREDRREENEVIEPVHENRSVKA